MLLTSANHKEIYLLQDSFISVSVTTDDLYLTQQFSKCDPPLGISDTFSQSPQGQHYFHKCVRSLFPLSLSFIYQRIVKISRDDTDRLQKVWPFPMKPGTEKPCRGTKQCGASQ